MFANLTNAGGFLDAGDDVQDIDQREYVAFDGGKSLYTYFTSNLTPIFEGGTTSGSYIFCDYCGRKYTGDDYQCPHCGAPPKQLDWR